jgi:drug/metabolite transporter (DMT)-like permease
MKHDRKEWIGLGWGLLGVLGFSLTLPATRLAVGSFGPVITGPGRAELAALLAAVVLAAAKAKLPNRSQLRSLLIIAAGVIIGFPLLTAWAMRHLPASHGAVVLALLPLATAGFAVLRSGEFPSRLFWLSGLGGSLTVIAYAWFQGLGSFHLADLALAGAVASAALGYAEGGKLTQEMPGWQVISWSLVLAAPFLIIPALLSVPAEALQAPSSAWASLAYLGLVSQYLAFVAWYNGMGMAGVAKTGQLQYLQPFFTLLFSAWLLGERLDGFTSAASILVVASVAAGRKAQVKRRNRP